MPRPEKPRNICEMPKYSVFGPKGERMNKLKQIELPIDELETIRLIDYLGYNQEEAANQMNVARTTVQRVYNIARKKVAESLIEGAVIIIEGGEIVLCDQDCEDCLGQRRFRNRQNNQK
ncbi:MAG: DUF134 domain-containing protein [Bacilli bacterium]|nr:DUF134 domain-containing protein [Bacilli bacterium]MBN2877743.1 DUF134 domain-containing protein [Bacilli bacterium]